MTYQTILKCVVCVSCAAWMLGVVPSALASDLMMKAPRVKRAIRVVSQTDETSSVSLVFLGAIRLYQKTISPIGGDRCGFWPSCSAYGYSAVREQGPLLGIIMIGDRLTRCNIWKEEGPDYFLLPSGKLYDPPSKNLLFEK